MEEVEKIATKIKQGKTLFNILKEEVEKSLVFEGKTLSEIKNHFKVKIDLDNITPTMLKEISIQLMDLSQEANFQYNVAALKYDLIQSGTTHTFDDEYLSILEKYKEEGKRPPAAPTIKVMASKKVSSLSMAETMAEIEMKFWKSIVEQLQITRKLLDTATLNTSVELKALNGDKYIDKISSDLIRNRSSYRNG